MQKVCFAQIRLGLSIPSSQYSHSLTVSPKDKRGNKLRSAASLLAATGEKIARKVDLIINMSQC